MAKSRDAFRTISEVAEWLDTPAHVLRFWESKFPQIKPVKRAGGRRYYRPEDMALLGGIKTLLHDQGMTIKGAQKMIRDMGVRHVAAMGPQPDTDDQPDVETEATEVGADAAPPDAPDTRSEMPPQQGGAASRGVAEPTLDDAPAMPEDHASPLPAPAQPLPDDVIARPAPVPGLLALVLTADAGRLRAHAATIAPVLERLERLRDLMRADQG